MSTFGINNAEDMRLITMAADTLSTAVGGDVVEAISSLRTAAFGMGITLQESAQNFDALGAIAVKLGAEGMDRFNRNVSLLGATMAKTGLSINDFAAFMIALGTTGGELENLMPRLRVQLEQLGDEGLSIEGIYERVAAEFGFTTLELEDFRDEVDLGTIAVKNQAREMARSLGPISAFRSALDDLKFQFGDILAPLADVGDAMIGIGATIFVMSKVLPFIATGFVAVAGGVAVFLGVSAAAAAGIVVLAAALVALSLALIFDWGGARATFVAAMEGLAGFAFGGDFLGNIKQSLTSNPFTSEGAFAQFGGRVNDLFTTKPSLPFTEGGAFDFRDFTRPAEQLGERRTLEQEAEFRSRFRHGGLTGDEAIQDRLAEATRGGASGGELERIMEDLGVSIKDLTEKIGTSGNTFNFLDQVTASEDEINDLTDRMRSAAEGVR